MLFNFDPVYLNGHWLSIKIRKMKRIALVLLCTLPGFIFTIAQDTPIKAGKISKEELEMIRCPIDSNARAMVICDYGKSYYDYTDNTGFQLHFDRLLRIKIFTKEGYDWADHEIELYKTPSSKEKLAHLKCFTYNLENGKVVKEKLKNGDVYTEERSKYWDVVKFSMPQVREGSVIELEYSVTSEFFFNLTPWYFQHDIPVAWSEYLIEIPEFLKYKKSMRGYVPLYVNESSRDQKSVMLTTKHNTGNKYVHSSSFETNVYNYNVLREHWVTKDVPAFIEEEPLTSSENYICKMEFELASYEPRSGQIENYTKTWEDINKLLLDDGDFGMQLNGGGYLKDLAADISASAATPEEKMVIAYNTLKNHMKWNEYNAVTASQSLRSAFSEGVGNSADINLMMVLLLRRLEIEAEPVAISTRAHGIIHPATPTISGFNYVIAAAFIGDNIYLMDATDPMVPFGMLPKRDLNDRGRIISEKRSGWVNLMINKPFKVFTMSTLSLGNDLNLSGSVQSACNDYAALSLRKQVNGYTSEDEYIQAFEDQHPGVEVTGYELINRRNYSESYKEKLEVNFADQITDAGGIYYFSPMLTEAVDENPFKLEERKYPVEYPYPMDVSFMLSLTIPEGFVVEELPENALVKLPGDGATFVYTVNNMGNMLQVMSKIQINKNIFLPDEYEYLKAFYDHIIAKHGEQVVLKKQ